MKVAAYTTLRHSFDHLYPVVEQLRLMGHSVPIYSSWKGADFATYVKTSDVKATDVDLWIVASSGDAKAVAPKPVVFIEHGCGQTYDADERTFESPNWSTGRIPNARLFLCPNRFVAQRRQNRHPDSLAICVGSAKMDAWHDLVGVHEQVEPNVVAFAWKFDLHTIPETRSAFEHYQESFRQIARDLVRRNLRPVMTAHPRSAVKVRNWASRTGFEWWPSDDVLTSAMVLCADNTSLMYEFALLDRPVVVLNAPWYRRNVHHGLRMWECIPGVEVDAPSEVVDAVLAQWNDPNPDERDCAHRLFEGFDGKASWRAAEAVSLLL